MFGTHKIKYYLNTASALLLFGIYQRETFKSTGSLVVITKVSLTSDHDTIIRYKIIEPKNGPEKELSEAQKHINNAKIMLGV